MLTKEGLSHNQVQTMRQRYGENSIGQKKQTSPWSIFFAQFSDFITITLIVATLLSAFLGEFLDAAVMIAIVVVNGIFTFLQEYKTEKSMEALRAMGSPCARVVRDGHQMQIPSPEVVVGDLLVLECGDTIAADCVLVQQSDIFADESMLSGESFPVQKRVCGEKELQNGQYKKDQILHMGSNITVGRGRAVVCAVGKNTEMGKIANLLQTTKKEQSPLKKKIADMGRILVFVCAVACIVIMLAGLYHGQSLHSMFFSGVSLAVAAIPEGLPATMTLVLALGVQRMMRQKALVRRMPAVETLGSVSIICSDKTGTLTQNNMRVTQVYAGKNLYQIKDRPIKDPTFDMLMRCGILCNNAYEQDGILQGAPTECAIRQAGMDASAAVTEYRRIKEYAFTSERKRMSVLCAREDGERVVFTKGAFDSLIALCDYIKTDQGDVLLDDQMKQEVLRRAGVMADQALRVIAFAYKKTQQTNPLLQQAESDLVFLGMCGIIDPPRDEVKSAIADCYSAGISPVMITGDHKNTALAIARQLNFKIKENGVMTGEELSQISDSQLFAKIKDISVFARVMPADKQRIVRAFKKHGHIVAMTGDGVNDAPALKEADIGIAMGNSGTDVAKDASDMILLDDNFYTIVGAVKEGRRIFYNIRKFIRYLLACNFGEILLMGTAAFVGLPVPLLPIQILWINLVTDSLPAMALGVDPPEDNIMQRRPGNAADGIFSGGLGGSILSSGLLIGGFCLLSFALSNTLFGYDLALSRSITFATMIVAELVFAFACRSEDKNIFQIRLRDNKMLVLANLVGFLLLLGLLYVPQAADIFGLLPLDNNHWAIVVLCAFGELFVSMFLNKIIPKKNGENEKKTDDPPTA